MGQVGIYIGGEGEIRVQATMIRWRYTVTMFRELISVLHSLRLYRWPGKIVPENHGLWFRNAGDEWYITAESR
jgi:hypothetical protein